MDEQLKWELIQAALDGEELGRVAVTAEVSVDRAGFPDCLKKVWGLFFTHTPAC